jgi:hypothetical protein
MESVSPVNQHFSSQYKLASLMNEFPVVGDGQGQNLSGSSGAAWRGVAMGCIADTNKAQQQEKIHPCLGALTCCFLVPEASRPWWESARHGTRGYRPKRERGSPPKRTDTEPTPRKTMEKMKVSMVARRRPLLEVL